GRWPLPNVWLGVSVENQATADERIPLLLQCPAAVRWISAEPLLGEVDLRKLHLGELYWLDALTGAVTISHDGGMPPGSNYPRITWVVAGGESGPGARPMYPNWARSLRDQCAAASVPFLFKQWGNWAPHTTTPGGDEGGDLRSGRVRYLAGDGRMPDGHFRCGDAAMANVGKKAAGRQLDGQLHDGYPI
ncbi:MAG TPA: DUF5131 family protein, partial [Rubrivivax sp.]|nr:DUF5131 family protein [Rubrivivax sp.]